MPGQGRGSRVAPQLPALEAGRKEQRWECGHTHPQVEGGSLEVEKKGEGFPVDFAHKRSTVCPKQPSPGRLQGNPQNLSQLLGTALDPAWRTL